MVDRSALTLKLLTYEADRSDRRRAHDIAAPSTSVASATGTTDTRGSATAAFSLYALLRLGFGEEAEAFMGLAVRSISRTRAISESGPLQ